MSFQHEEYRNCYVGNIRRGDAEMGRDCYIYATLFSESGKILIMADIDYITKCLHERMPDHESKS